MIIKHLTVRGATHTTYRAVKKRRLEMKLLVFRWIAAMNRKHLEVSVLVTGKLHGDVFAPLIRLLALLSHLSSLASQTSHPLLSPLFSHFDFILSMLS